jgi:hypothetical protein
MASDVSPVIRWTLILRNSIIERLRELEWFE